MRKIVLVLVVLFVGLSLTTEASAWRWRRRPTTTTNRVQLTGSYQQQAQQKVNLMAKYNRMSHSVAPIIASFEGIGRSTSTSKCSTCTPRRGMTLVADASARSSSGMWYRCRAWR